MSSSAFPVELGAPNGARVESEYQGMASSQSVVLSRLGLFSEAVPRQSSALCWLRSVVPPACALVPFFSFSPAYRYQPVILEDVDLETPVYHTVPSLCQPILKLPLVLVLLGSIHNTNHHTRGLVHCLRPSSPFSLLPLLVFRCRHVGLHGSSKNGEFSKNTSAVSLFRVTLLLTYDIVEENRQ